MSPRNDAIPTLGWQWTAVMTVLVMLLAASFAHVSGNLAISFDGTASCAPRGMAPVTLETYDAYAEPPEQPDNTEAPVELEASAARRGVFDSFPQVQGVAVTPRRAIASLVPSIGDPHLATALTLAYSLRRSGNALPLVLFHIEGGGFSPAGREAAERAGWEMRALQRVEPFHDTKEKYTDAYTKLRLWDLADDFDHLLYLDLDTLALGRIEVALEFFVSDGKRASQPLGATRNQRPRTDQFNTGVMAIQPDHAFFEALIAAGRDESFRHAGGLADQSFLNAFLNGQEPDDSAQAYSWIELPPACNLMVRQLLNYYDWFQRQLPDALLLHYAGSNVHGFMRDLVQFDEGKTKIVNTTVAEQEQKNMGALWADAWAEASRILDLPRPLPSETPERHLLDTVFKTWSFDEDDPPDTSKKKGGK